MSVNALELSITEESHQSVLVEKYRFDFLYNMLYDCWFLYVYENENIVYASIKITPNKNLFSFLDIGELIVFTDKKVTRDELMKSRVVYVPRVEDEV